MSRLVARVRAALGGAGEPPLDPADPDLVVVVTSDDAAEACSAALERSPGFVAGREVLLRHHLLLPAGAAGGAAETAAQDGYAPAPADAPGLPGAGVAGLERLTLQRVQLLDALHCSQERSRMAGLAQRLDGRVTGWDALQPVAPDPGGAR
ncbi:hypothetical protein [Rhodococcus aerolatus]